MTGAWFERFLLTRETDRSEMLRPSYWYTDIGDYPNARFNLCYAGDENRSHRLQLLYPEGYDTENGDPLPLILFIHGGGFRGGHSERNGRSILYTCEASLYALNAGYAVALTDYRLNPETDIFGMIADVKCAIRYLRSNADKLRIDAGRIALHGESAGGYLVNFAGLTGDHPDFHSADMPCPDVSDRVSAVVTWYSCYHIDSEDFRKMFFPESVSDEAWAVLKRILSPSRYITADAPPFLIQAGTADDEVDVQNSIDLYNDLCSATGKTENALDLVDDANHAVRWFISRHNAERIIRWLNERMK